MDGTHSVFTAFSFLTRAPSGGLAVWDYAFLYLSRRTLNVLLESFLLGIQKLEFVGNFVVLGSGCRLVSYIEIRVRYNGVCEYNDLHAGVAFQILYSVVFNSLRSTISALILASDFTGSL